MAQALDWYVVFEGCMGSGWQAFGILGFIRLKVHGPAHLLTKQDSLALSDSSLRLRKE